MLVGVINWWWGEGWRKVWGSETKLVTLRKDVKKFLVVPCNLKEKSTPQEPTRDQYPSTSYTKAKKSGGRTKMEGWLREKGKQMRFERERERDEKLHQKWFDWRYWNWINICPRTNINLIWKFYMKGVHDSMYQINHVPTKPNPN